MIIVLMILYACNSTEEKEESAKTNEQLTEAVADNSNGYTLERKFEKGKSFTTTIDYNEIMKSKDSQGNNTKEETNARQTWTSSITKVISSNEAKFKMNYNRIQFNEYDSDDPSSIESDKHSIFSEILNKNVTYTMSSTGEIMNLAGAEDMYKSIGGQEIDDNRILAEDLSLASRIYPDQKVNVGNSWEKSLTISFGYPMTYDITYTLLDIDKSKALISLEGVIKPYTDGPPTRIGDITMRHELTGFIRGKATMDISNGLVYHMEITEVFQGTYDMEMPGQPAITDVPISVERITVYINTPTEMSNK